MVFYNKKKAYKYFNGKVILITGASSGFGKSLALDLSDFNTKIFLAARRKKELMNLENFINKNSVSQAIACMIDITKEDEVIRLFKKIEDKYGRLDIMVISAGVIDYQLVQDYNLDLDKQIMNVNYHGSALCIRESLRIMLFQNRGHIFVMNSLAGLISPPYMSSYNASKYALTSFIETAKAELIGNRNITFTSFHPGDFDSTELGIGKNNPSWAFDKYRWVELKKVVKVAIYVMYKKRNFYIFPGYYALLYRILKGVFPSLIIWLCSKSIKKDKKG